MKPLLFIVPLLALSSSISSHASQNLKMTNEKFKDCLMIKIPRT